MDIGMLWFDNDPSTSFQSKVLQASMYYQKKYGRSPDICFVHPSMVDNGAQKKEALTGDQRVKGVQVEGSDRVLPHHFWIGVSNGVERG